MIKEISAAPKFPAPRIGKLPDVPMERALTGTYVLGVLWDSYSAQTEAHVTRDLLHLKTVCDKARVQLVVACDKDNLDRVLAALDIKRVSNVMGATYYRSYYTNEEPEVPNHSELCDVIKVSPNEPVENILSFDTTFPEEVYNRTVVPIPSQVPWDRMPSPYGNPMANQVMPGETII